MDPNVVEVFILGLVALDILFVRRVRASRRQRGEMERVSHTLRTVVRTENARLAIVALRHKSDPAQGTPGTTVPIRSMEDALALHADLLRRAEKLKMESTRYLATIHPSRKPRVATNHVQTPLGKPCMAHS